MMTGEHALGAIVDVFLLLGGLLLLGGVALVAGLVAVFASGIARTVAVIFVAFVLSGCCTAAYENEIVTPAHKKYCQSPFNVYYYEGDNTDGHYIGLESYEGADYEAFVFKNLIETDEDNYIKILLPHEEAQSEENEYPNGIRIIACTKEDFAEEKMIAPATIYVPHRDSKHLRLQAVHNKELHKYKFAFNFPAKDVLSFYKKKRAFPAYIFCYLGYPFTISLDIITLPVQILAIVLGLLICGAAFL